MDLSTTYLGLRLSNPVVPGASPLADDLDTVKRLEDAGAGAIVMRSLFEEQIQREQMAAHLWLDGPGESFAEALSYFPSAEVFSLGPEQYLEHLRKIRKSVNIPVIASLNGHTLGGWLEYAALMEEAGASALELNIYALPSDPDESASVVEARAASIVRSVAEAVKIPVSVKLSSHYSSLPHFARSIESAGAKGLVLFNRFYQPDIDPEALDVTRTLHLSDRFELNLRLHWLAVLSAQRAMSFAASGGVHEAVDVVKAGMAGAHVVQIVSALLKSGPAHLRTVIADLSAWMEEHEYESWGQLWASMNLERCPNPSMYERGNYAHLLQTWHGDGPARR